MKRRIIIHTDTALKPVTSKTESELLRYLNSEIIGVIDPANAGSTVEAVLGFGGNIPIASSLDEFLTSKPNYLLLGSSSFKGTFPMEWYPMVIKALQLRIHILNGLHQPLSSLAEFDLLAKKYKAQIIDLRSIKENPVKFRNFTGKIQAKKILIAGANINSGQLTTTLEITKSIHKNGVSADWIPTGLASRLIKGRGIIAESLSADLVSGYIENDLLEQDQKFEYLFIEGQGAINDPINSGVSLSILHGARPDAVILCCRVDSVHDAHRVQKAKDNYQHLLRQVNSAPIVGISLNTALLSEEEGKQILKEVQETLHLPVINPIKSDLTSILEVIKQVEK